jgi:hypothetical protein
MRTKIIYLLFVCISLQTIAQEKTTMKTFGEAVTDKFPTTRTFDVQYEQLGPTNFDSKLFGEPLEKGRIDNHNRLKFAFNLPFYVSDSKRFIMTSSLRYKYESYDFGETYANNSDVPFSRGKEGVHYFAAALSATYMAKLFNKPIIYNATATIDGNQENVQRLKGIVSATLVLKRTANTTITVGALAMLDPSSIIPITPLFSYNHKFENSKWDFDFILPQRLLFRRELFESGRIAIGTELNSDNFYLNLDTPKLKGIYELNQLELKSGVTYDHRFTPKLIGLFKAGINNVISTRITERGERTTKYIYDQKEETQAYFRFGISYNPF